MADIDALSRLIRKADAVAESASVLVSRTLREIRGELANLAEELNLAGSAKDRETVYNDIQRRMAALSRRMDRLMSAQNELAAETAAKQVSAMTGLEVKYSAKRAEAITELVTPAQGENLAAVFTQRMAADLIRTLQAATVAVLREQAIEGGTMKEMTRRLAQKWREAAKVSDPRFTDASGRTWDTATYLTMNVRTNTMRVYNDCLLDDIARATGSDIARISKGGGDPHCVCAAWEGAIISISGKTKGLPTYEQARNGGCFHPNCVHTLEYVDEDADAEEIELQKAHPVTKGLEDDPDVQKERRYEIDQHRYRNRGMTKDAARLAVDRDNLTDAIRTGLIREDARELVGKLTDAQVSALVKDGVPPRFMPTKKATKKDPHAADEKWIHGKRGGVVHIARDADVEKLLEVTKVKDAKTPEPPKESTKPKSKMPSHTVVQGKNLEDFVGSPDAGVSLTKQVIQAQGFDGKPLIVSDEEEFNRLATKSGIMGYRGLGDGAEIPNYVKALREGDYYVECKDGGRVNGRGTYFAITSDNGTHSNSFKESKLYAQKAKSKFKNTEQQEYIFKATVSDDIKIANVSDIRKIRKDWVIEKLRPYTLKALSASGTKSAQFRKFIDDIIHPRENGELDGILDIYRDKYLKLWNAFKNQGIDIRGILESDVGTIAAEKGYDALRATRCSYLDGVDYLVLLNRTKLILFDKDVQNDNP